MQPRIQRRDVAGLAGDWPRDVHPVLRRVYLARGITSPADIEHKLAALLAPQTLGGIERACELLDTAIREDARIVIVGDFDCDGATGTAVGVRGLRLLGAHNVSYAVPNRIFRLCSIWSRSARSPTSCLWIATTASSSKPG